MRITSFFSVFLLCAAVALPGVTLAASAVEVQTMRDNTFRAATQMLMYVALDKAKERRAAADKAMAGIDSTVTSINDTALTTQWQKTKSTLNGSPYLNGEVNQLVLYAWENEAMALVSEVDRLMPRNIDQSRKDIYDLAANQVMLLIYLRNSTDPLGGTNYTGVNYDKDLAALTTKYTAQLNKVIKSNPKHAAVLGKVKSKWVFLSGRFSDYRQHPVPFIADLYGRQIIDLLLTTANKG